MAKFLPDDVLHLICEQSWLQRDFDTLYNCAQAGKQFAAPALTLLYRMHEVAPVTSRGSDEVEIPRQARAGESTKSAEQMSYKWALLWRTMILSSLEKTLYPYCRYIRTLNLEDLRDMLEESRSRGEVNKMFFAGDLQRYKVESVGTTKGRGKGTVVRKLKTTEIVIAVGEGMSPALTLRTPMLEELTMVEVPSPTLAQWLPRTPYLRHLTVWNGSALDDDVGNLLRKYCPSFKSLQLWDCVGDDADNTFAKFLNAIRPQSLDSFKLFSVNDIGAESFLAFNCHCTTLTELEIQNIRVEAMPSLSMLQGCISLKSLVLTEAIGNTDLDSVHNEVFLEIITWLRNCKNLRNITLHRFANTAGILTPVLLENDIHLHKIDVEGYVVKDSRTFHQALAHQQTLRHVLLKGDPDEMVRDDIDVLVDSLSKLKCVTNLRLRDISDYFRDEHIYLLARNLPCLEEWATSGYGISDAIWEDTAALKSLRRLDLSAITRFSRDGILDYISRLGPGNKGLNLAVMMQEVEYALSDEEISIIKETIAAKVDGRFDLQLIRDPEISEFEGESD